MSTQQAGANTRVQKTAGKTQPAGSRTNIARFHVQEASQAAWLPPRTGDAGWFPGAAGGQGALSCKGGEAAVRPDGDTLAIPRDRAACSPEEERTAQGASGERADLVLCPHRRHAVHRMPPGVGGGRGHGRFCPSGKASHGRSTNPSLNKGRCLGARVVRSSTFKRL